jgi:hypothetical protein
VTLILRDDFAYIIDVKSEGFYSSNQDGGYDDIYKFTETRKLTCKHLSGKITDIDSKTQL